jgi:alpha-glucoside transport system substrate-binding protein
MRGHSLLKITAVAMAALLTASCFGGGSSSSSGSGGKAGAKAGGDKVVEIMGAFGGAEAAAFIASLADFEKSSGIKVNYTPTTSFETLIRSRVQGNNAPDIAVFPQPGILVDLANQNKLEPLEDVSGIDLAGIKKTLVPGMAEATVAKDGKTYGLPMRMAVKSIVWTPKPAFEQKGFTVPKTQSELLALTDKIKASGTAPWCIGMQSGSATGWVATDWIEEYVLRIGGPDVYQKWVKHEIPFNDPVVKKAAQEFEKIAFPDGNVLGGRPAIISTPFGTAGNPMFQNPPACYLHRQGNFITSGDFFPKDVIANLPARTNVFQLPPVDGGAVQGPSVLLGGDLASIFNRNNPDAVAVFNFITGDKFGGPWAKAGGWLSPHKTFDGSQYIDDTTRQIAKFAIDAQATAFDGSDQMPGAVGSGSFWKGMVAWISGQQDLDTTLNQIEASWPKS